MFKKDDLDKAIKFVNMLATKARFDNLSVKEIAEIRNQFHWCESVLLPTIRDNIFEAHAPKPMKPYTEANNVKTD